MNRERTKKLLPIIEAFANGEDIQIKASDKWLTWESYSFDSKSEYRIKPNPREWWVNVYDKGSVIHETKESARSGSAHTKCELIKVREVLDENL